MKIKMTKVIIVGLMILCTIPNIIAQNRTIDIENEEEKAWVQLDSMKAYLCDWPLQCAWYDNATFLEQRLFEESVFTKRVQLAENFMDKYPDSEHYFETLTFYLYYLFEPRFISKQIPDSTKVFLSQDAKSAKDKRAFKYSQFRAIPIDIEARVQWLKKGRGLVSKFLLSNATREQKLKIEISLLGRDFRHARYLYEFQNFQKKDMESSYWQAFSWFYWEPFLLRMESLLFKYSDIEDISSYIEQLVNLISRKLLAPELTKLCWKYFFDLSLNTEHKHEKEIMALHQMAKENLKALYDLEAFDDSKPLEMTFTTMDSSHIDLKDLRGKVVLLDFWSTACAPCIIEMPYVQKMYEKYADKGFEVIGIAANSDSDREHVLNIINKQNAKWPQYLDKGSKVNVSYHSLYKISSLPTVWLLDKSGRIVDTHARGERLEPLIRKYLGLDKN
ncbi:Thiol-disulfide isomerase or thioredoxin [Flaviramulus basaltis]|uniref:Thiol-disulfide isomerase or thioredoxin n=1 Tax=Flaviramulus basaltis TaxID=369401 RepID=A0A1K2IBA7_9FLAO|nr:TlpA disulfide reductase family protein [Flaviramulus basaltis]SFZ89526.1 Thiol-disulfide isomerase or thioredoxin [Flaviramulus basaltis]